MRAARVMVVASVLTLAAGCASGEDAREQARVDREVHAAEDFETFEIPWLGREFEGMPLALVDLPGDVGDDEDDRSVELDYGACDEEDPGSGCTYELSITADPRYARGRGALPRRRIGGVPARVAGPLDAEVQLYGRGLTVTVNGDRFRQVLRAARALHGLNEAPQRSPRLR